MFVRSQAGFRYAEDGWSNTPDGCRVERCPEAPVGEYFVDGCDTQRCTNAPVSGVWLSVCPCTCL